MKDKRFIGTVVTVNSEGYGFIGTNGLIGEDGSDAGLGDHDVFVHQDECAVPLKVGIQLNFIAVPDAKRGVGFCRAVGAVEHVETAMIPVDEEPVPGLVLRRRYPYLQPEQIAYLLRMKEVPAAAVAKADANRPLEGVPRIEEEFTPEQQRQLCESFLRNQFPTLASYSADVSLTDADDATLDATIGDAKETMQHLGLNDQIPVLEEEVDRFKRVRGSMALIWREGLVRPDAIIPIERFMDLYTACPVVYFWAQGDEANDANRSWDNPDPKPHPMVMELCNLYPTERWRNFFQLYNRRIRTLRHYRGENIPAHILRRIRVAVGLFDAVMILTPYHDVAGKEWVDPEWMRAIDPYVVGYHKGLRHFFVLGRYSDAGTFPLLSELFADTMEFLRANRGKVSGFNAVSSPYWCDGHNPNNCFYGHLGTYLQEELIDPMLTAFEGGYLFPWLKGEVDIAKQPAS
ncbi:MAG: hypothetical protein V1778_01630 [bacterium]